MPFVPSGKKAKMKRAQDAKGGITPDYDPTRDLEVLDGEPEEPDVDALRKERRRDIIDGAVAGARLALAEPGLGLPMCVLVERILATTLPPPRFTLRLGSLRVYPEDEGFDPFCLDPTGPDGIDGGVHTWLEDPNGVLLDPSIMVTLAANGYEAHADEYVSMTGREFALSGLNFIYEELPDLELLGVREAEPHLARIVALVLSRAPITTPGRIALDVGWRSSAAGRR
jgi:hypothetical protein